MEKQNMNLKVIKDKEEEIISKTKVMANIEKKKTRKKI